MTENAARPEAELLSMAFGDVKLKKADGKIITIPLERLSEKDQEWIRKRRGK